VTDHGVEGPLRLDEFEQAAALPFEQAFFECAKDRDIEPPAAD
jgi:hypothetical protein